jgi:hypothetical protein
MAISAVMTGARLAFVVRELEGTVKRPQMRFERGEGLTRVWVEEPAGYMVYFPRGHAIRVRDKKTLKHYGLHKTPPLSDLRGLEDPNSPVGKLFRLQEEKGRAEAFSQLENQVIALATAKTGTTLMPEQTPNFVDGDEVVEDEE